MRYRTEYSIYGRFEHTHCGMPVRPRDKYQRCHRNNITEYGNHYMYERTIGKYFITDRDTFFWYYGCTDVMWSIEGTDIRTIKVRSQDRNDRKIETNFDRVVHQ
jgi:hypothetical protein